VVNVNLYVRSIARIDDVKMVSVISCVAVKLVQRLG